MHMGKRWIPERQYSRMPHAEERAPSLWWYARQPDPAWADDIPMPESQCVMDTYLRQCARGRSLPKNFGETLRRWLQDLSREQRISPRRKRYWTIPAYAFAHKMPSKTFCKRFRELENIAKELFPHRVPRSRASIVLTEEKTQAIRQRVLEGTDIRAVASEFGIPPFRVGQLCREEKAAFLAKREEWAARDAETESSTDEVIDFAKPLF
jgi:hypothetical protein